MKRAFIQTTNFISLLVFFIAGASLPAGSGDKPTPEQQRFFETQVRPILQAHCLPCHGGEKQVRGGLRLTSREAILQGGDSGPAVNLDTSETSLLLAVLSHQEQRKMPPRGKLPQAQIDVLTRWVKMGLPWSGGGRRRVAPPVDAAARRFWSFRPVSRPEPPTVRQGSWVRNPIDAFVLSKLEDAGLEPAPPASKAAILRRVTYDLTGLPPTPEEITTFLDDTSPGAYEKVVDRLLVSPQYGEHWARHWLDLVRYAESNGFERDGTKPFVWRYRDYVIRSFNNDKPYDQFIREQLAGDELDSRTDDGLIATGYYRLGPWDDEPSDPVQALYDDLNDIVSTTGQVFLGLTVGCARCHDHKYDPFPQRDYYRLLAYFHGIQRYGVRSPDTVAAASLRPLASVREQERQRKELAAYRQTVITLTRQMKAIEDAVRPHLSGGECEDFAHVQHRPAILRKHVPDLLSKQQLDTYLALAHQREVLQQFAPAALAQALCVTEIGRTPRDTYVLQRGNHQAPGERVEPGFPTVLAPIPRVEGSTDRRPNVHERAANPLDCWLLLSIFLGGVSCVPKKPALPWSWNVLAFLLVLGLVLSVGVGSSRSLRTLAQRYYDSEQPFPVAERRACGGPEAAREESAQTAPPPTQGPQAAGETSGRRRLLAEWIASPQNPLTARVMVNRVWQYHFGRGIVRSSSDFGYQGTPPTHPELLDWLASEFVAGGMRLKSLHKLIVMSNTYRMSAHLADKTVEKDPENALFGRFEMRRLTAEEVRDSILGVCGNLNLKMGGPSVYPQVPQEVLYRQSNPGWGWNPLCPPEEQNRRSIYIHIKRALSVPLLAAFDASDTDGSCPVRFTTTQPAQALAMLNSDFLIRQAGVFAANVRRDAGASPTAQVSEVLRRVLQRDPAPKEVERGVGFLTQMRGESRLAGEEALRAFCLMALNLNEFVYLD